MSKNLLPIYFLIGFVIFVFGFNFTKPINSSENLTWNYSINVKAQSSEEESGEESGGEEESNRESFSGAGGVGIEAFDLIGVRCLVPNQPNCGSGEQDLITNIIGFLNALAIPGSILVILWGGYRFYFSGISEGQTDGKKSIMAGVIGLALVLSANFISALVQGSFTEEGGLNSEPLLGAVGSISDFLLNISSVIAVLVIIWGGYKYFFSGLPGEQKNGMDTIQAGAIGLIVTIIARPIVNLISGTFLSTEEGDLNLDTNPIINFILNLIQNFAIPLSTVITVFFFVFGSYYIITARGDSSMVEKGRDSLKNATIGLIIVLLSTTIVQLITIFIPTG